MGRYETLKILSIMDKKPDDQRNLSVIVTSSFIKSHPSIEIIKKTLESLKFINHHDFELFITHDYSAEDNFFAYIENLKNYLKKSNYPDIKILLSDKPVHLTGTIREAIKYVKTKYVLIVQHDLPFIKNFDVNKIISDMEEAPHIKYVRFNKRKNIKAVFDALNDLFGKEISCTNYTYTRTPAWSDNNHLCLTSYYENLILKECLDGRPMEDQLHGKSIDEKSHSKFGTYLFGKNHDGPYIEHTDGKNFQSDMKILPLMNSEEIVDLVSYLSKHTFMLEIGGGKSSIFLSKIVKQLVTLEHDRKWANQISDFGNIDHSSWDLHVVEPNWPQSHCFQPAEPGQFDNYVNFISTLEDNKFDIVLIDGRDRVRSTLASLPNIKQGGIILIHDFWNRSKYHSLLSNPGMELIEDKNSFGKIPSNTLVAFRKK